MLNIGEVHIMPTTLSIPEVVKKISQTAQSKEDVIRMLRENNSHAFKLLLQYAFIDSSKWYRQDLPPYTPDNAPEGLTVSSLFQEVKRLYIFKESYNLPKERKDILMIQMLEAIHPDEALMVKELFSGTFYGYGINKQLVIDAFPDITATVVSS